MAGGGSRRRAAFSGNRFTAGRPIPKRGQVKVAILIGLAHSVASIGRRAASHFH